MLGLDPFLVANEGKLVAIVPYKLSEDLLTRMREHRLGKNAAKIGHVVAQHPGIVASRTAIGGKRIIQLPLGEQLPRIC